eukprot:TRINITY_DN17498_c0_g1_i2.p2 TRINITY_DN17498_c0_g1~~TRINITY_DN17498_c0_g1_i2.p2  ORF type:complete len:110 (+),score=4.27 TRINITY_DN17498_c0_g1_i2:114-443(+)
MSMRQFVQCAGPKYFAPFLIAVIAFYTGKHAGRIEGKIEALDAVAAHNAITPHQPSSGVTGFVAKKDGRWVYDNTFGNHDVQEGAIAVFHGRASGPAHVMVGLNPFYGL